MRSESGGVRREKDALFSRSTLHFPLAFVLAALFGAAKSTADEPQLKVMTYNIRYASPLGANSWPVRRPLVQQLIESHSPDILGTQEGLYHQLKDLEKDLKAYRWIGLGREGGSRGEFMAVFYKLDRLEPIEYDHYWLSDTPDVIGSATWGNTVRRMVTWVKFRDLAVKQDFYFVNTHFDHQVENARRKSAELLLERTKKLGTNLPVIVTGDFNSPAGASGAYETLVGPEKFSDSFDSVKRTTDRTQTFNGFHYPAPKEGARIDWILFRGPIQPLEIEIDDFAEESQYPSDHFPVIATFRYNSG